MSTGSTKSDQLTVGWLRQQIDGLDDSVKITPDWEYGPPGDGDPAVVVHVFHVRRPDGEPPELIVRVGIEYLNDFEEEDEDEDEE